MHHSFAKSHIWSLWMVNSTRFSYSQTLVFRCYVHKAKICSDVLVQVKEATEMQVPMLLLLLNRRFFIASKTQWIDHVSPFASIWCYQLTFWHIFHSRIFFFKNLEISLEFRVSARKSHLHLSDSLCIDSDSSALRKSLCSLCFEGFPMSYPAVAFHKSWIKFWWNCFVGHTCISDILHPSLNQLNFFL